MILCAPIVILYVYLTACPRYEGGELIGMTSLYTSKMNKQFNNQLNWIDD